MTSLAFPLPVKPVCTSVSFFAVELERARWTANEAESDSVRSTILIRFDRARGEGRGGAFDRERW